jgi:hypothetical protein
MRYDMPTRLGTASLCLTAVTMVMMMTSATVRPASGADGGPGFDYSDWRQVLEARVDEQGRVDYDGLREDRAALDRFLAAVADTGPGSTPERFPGSDERLAFLINAYNALVFEGVLGLSPKADSVWGFTGTGYSFFARMKVLVDGKTTTLKKLEDDDIREAFGDPRIHAALNCASIGCPRLPREPFLPETLDEQLDHAMREFVGAERNCAVDLDAGTVTLSKIFDWFSGDFTSWLAARGESDGDLIDYVNRYRDEDERIPDGLKVGFSDYDKGLNRQ